MGNKKLKRQRISRTGHRCEPVVRERLSERALPGGCWGMGSTGGTCRKQVHSIRGFSCWPISGHWPSAPNQHPGGPHLEKGPEATLHCRLGAFTPKGSSPLAHQEDTYLKQPPSLRGMADRCQQPGIPLPGAPSAWQALL